MTAAVLLRHIEADGRWHFDWMIERPDSTEERRLVTFRIAQDLRTAADVTVAAERIDDHRAVYLTWTGPLSGGRGEVKRVWSAACRAVRLEERFVDVVLAWAGGGSRRWRGERVDGSAWRFERIDEGA